MECFATFFKVLSVFHGDLSRANCFEESPSIQYSILRKIISMKIVCGHAHPHHILPNTAVKRIIKTIKVISASTKRKKSCGQKGMPKTKNFRSMTLNSMEGWPLILMNGHENSMI